MLNKYLINSNPAVNILEATTIPVAAKFIEQLTFPYFEFEDGTVIIRDAVLAAKLYERESRIGGCTFKQVKVYGNHVEFHFDNAYHGGIRFSDVMKRDFPSAKARREIQKMIKFAKGL